ncbi:MAG: SDR family oxidoreductase [Betaproteobacteria bacterium]|nr:SDR family oxidoreductase [Betaproteobacteria bacterium]
MRVINRVALITGSSRGIGAAIAKAMGRQGITTIVNYLHSADSAANVLREIERAGGKGLAIQADVTIRTEVERMVKSVGQAFGHIDILVNNAHRPFAPKGFMELTWDEIQQQVDGTIKSAFNCTQAVLPGMRRRRWGRILNIGSISVDQPEPGFHARDLAKAALLSLTRELAFEMGAAGITVNTISPGWTHTDQAGAFPDEMKAKALARTPVGRLAEPEDIAAVAVFLASEDASFITGISVPVCGGAIMK